MKRITPNTLTGRTLLSCSKAKALEVAGEYQAAWKEMEDIWKGVGHRPDIEKLSKEAAAEVLLRAGSLTGWIGSARQLEGAQEASRDLACEAQRLFTDPDKITECANVIALSYWKEGNYEYAKVLLREALASTDNVELKFSLTLNIAAVEWNSQCYPKSLSYQNEAGCMVDKIKDPALLGRFHNGNALSYRSLGNEDKAFIEYAMASKYFAEAGHARFRARVENNLAFLYYKKGMHAEALESADVAYEIFVKFGDRIGKASIEETRARIFIEEKRYRVAEVAARHAVDLLEQGDGDALLVDYLTTHGVALSRLGDRQAALNTLRRAADLAYNNISVERAADVIKVVFEEITGIKEHSFSYAGMSIDEAISNLRKKMIREALEATSGDLRLAAERLRVRHYQTLQYYLNDSPEKYSELKLLRKPVKRRKVRP